MTTDHHWTAEANCRNENPETFCTEDDPHIVLTAKLICRACPVQTECFNEAAAHEDWHGIRAGLIGPTRRRLAQGKDVASHTPHHEHHATIQRLTDQGWTAINIAGYLDISTRTVERARARARARLASTERANA